MVVSNKIGIQNAFILCYDIDFKRSIIIRLQGTCIIWIHPNLVFTRLTEKAYIGIGSLHRDSDSVLIDAGL